MVNIRHYNYYVWTDQLKRWWGDAAVTGGRALDIGCGNGDFLRQLLELRLVSEAVGIDIAVDTTSEGQLSLKKMDFCKSEIAIDPSSFDTLFFMNMFYVLPTLESVEHFLKTSNAQNLIVTIPNSKALSFFEKRHPDVNILNRNLETFLSKAGYTVKRKHETLCSHYYLRHPLQTLAGSMSRKFSQRVERLSENSFYEMIWLTRDSRLEL